MYVLKFLMLKELFGKFYTQTTWEAGSFIVLHREQTVPILLSIIPLGMHHVQDYVQG